MENYMEYAKAALFVVALIAVTVVAVIRRLKDRSGHRKKQSPAPVKTAAPARAMAGAAAPTDEKAQIGAGGMVYRPSEECSDEDIIDNIAAISAKKERSKKPVKRSYVSESTAPATKKERKKQKQLVEKSKDLLAAPTSVQQSIPYREVFNGPGCADGIIKNADGRYSKTYKLTDTNYIAASDENKKEMLDRFAELLNSFDPTLKFQFNIVQKKINMMDFERQVKLEMQDDGYDDLRIERNELLNKEIMEKQKYLTVSAAADNIQDATNVFARLDKDIPNNVRKIGLAKAEPLCIEDRLELIHNIYNPDDEGMFGNNVIKTVDADGNTVYEFAENRFDFDILRRSGLSTKDFVAPGYMEFGNSHIMLGKKYARALFLRSLPDMVSDDIISSLTQADIQMVTSMQYTPIPAEDALKKIRSRLTNIDADLLEKQQKASKGGYSAELVSLELRNSHEETERLFNEILGKSQSLYSMGFCIVHFADSKEQLDSDTKAITSIFSAQKIRVQELTSQQEAGLNSALPLALSQLASDQTITSESAGAFLPFTNAEILDRDGWYYGTNRISGSPILLQKKNLKNANGWILGTPGSGKSFQAKQEMMTVLLSSPSDRLLVIDPEGEYYPMANLLGGEVVQIGIGSRTYINPMDIDLNLDGDDNAVSIKSDFITSFVEICAGERNPLSPSQKSVLDRCVRLVYKPYIESYDPETRLYDSNLIPTLSDLYQILRLQQAQDPSARQLADTLEIYVTGSLNIFAHRTNVDYKGRFVVFDISGLGSVLKPAALLVILDHCWNQFVAGRKKHVYTHLFVDEIYLLFQNETSALFLEQIYKRSRKYFGLITAITQNCSDLLKHDAARTMIANSEYIELLDQKAEDRLILKQLMSLSDTELNYITNSNPGEGIIYNGSVTVPFSNQIPKNTKMYRAATTKPGEVGGHGGETGDR